MIKTLLRLLFLLIFLSFYSFVNPDISEIKTKPKPKGKYPFEVTNQSWVDSVYNSLSLDEKIGQLFMVSAYTGVDNSNKELIESLITKYKIGGLIFMQGTPIREAQYTNYFQSISKTPLMMAIDGEWGLAMRLDSTISFPKQLMLGAIQDNKLIYQMGKEIGRQCERIGLQINFAPVVDVNNNPQNPIINYRSFGEIKENVAIKGEYYMAGMQDMHILTTAKHFPGHGDTDSDSHKSLPIINHKKKRLDTLELFPFKHLINNDLTGMMVAHLYIPAYDKTENQASTLSPKVVNKLLKKDLGFSGLIFTDALNMKGVAKYYKPGEVEVKALQAGNDVLLFPEDVPVAVEYIKQAIKNGELSISVIEERCKKIISAKQWMGLDTLSPVKIENLYADLNTAEANILDKKLIRAAITVVKNEDGILPFREIENSNIAYVSFCSHTNDTFYIAANNYTTISKFCFPPSPTDTEVQAVLDTLKSYKTVILNIEGASKYSYKKYGITQRMVDITSKIASANNTVMVLHANPYALDFFTNVIPSLKSIVVAYDFTNKVQFETPQVMFGAYEANGQLPVSAGGINAGTGIKYKALQRLQYTTPEEAGLNKRILAKIDSIALDGIKEMAMPGCQVLVARNGKVAYQKSFGYFTYDKKHAVTNDDIYDLASITKSAATTVSLMKLYDEGLFSLDAMLGEYFPDIDSTDKDTLRIKNILTHQAQLHSWIPFYQYMIKDYFNPDVTLKSRWKSSTFPYRLGENAYLKYDMQFVDSSISTIKTDLYSVKVAENVYINPSYRDTIYNQIMCSELYEEKKVVYSDLGFYLFPEVIANLSGKKIDEFVYTEFYNSLGADKMKYNPSEYYSKNYVAPTEYDQVFRKQVLQGYVHDPGAAMLGGVSGHAGLFSNTNDLAKLLQMLENGGYYGGKQYLEEETIELFTSCPFCEENRKGYGFDKAWKDPSKLDPTCSCTSEKSYGHSGFTGTIFWVDPEYDLIYIFLSNRVYPDADNPKLGRMNIRPKIQEAIYQALE